MRLPLNQIIQGDCIEVLQGFPENSVDLVVTDPPYGLNFMGKEWDKALPPREAFKEMYRVLKPGALAFVMSSPRQDLVWRMCALLEESGFDLSQSFISWIYKTGFPKAYDVSKGIDKKLGLEREVIGYSDPSDPKQSGRGGGSGFNTTHDKIQITVPSSVDAKKWDGWKAQTGLKPALEPILMVNKPFSESTLVDNVLCWGTGAINIDACRIPITNEKLPSGSGDRTNCNLGNMWNPGWKGNEGNLTSPQGRFPANLLVSDDAIDDGETTKNGKYSPHHVFSKDKNGNVPANVYGKYQRLSPEQYPNYADEGSKSRYFDLDAWAKHHGFLDVAKPASSERDFGLKNKREEVHRAGHGNKEVDDVTARFRTMARNTHPTVKPIKLMAYLIELGCPKNGVVLDPFVGSGTTCIAAKRLCRRYIGIELNEEYHALAISRVAAYPQPLEWFGENVLKRERT